MTGGGLKGFAGGRQHAPTPGTVVAVLDIGSSKVSCFVAVVEPGKGPAQRAIRIIGSGTTVSRGIAHGAISNLDEAERSIRLAVDAAERSARLRIHDIHVTMTGGRPQSVTANATIRVSSGVVGQRDVDTAIAAAIGKADIGRRHVLHVVPARCVLDGVETDDTPLGMHGHVLGMEAGIVSVETAAYRNLLHVIGRAHLEPASLSLSTLAAGRGVLLADELALGALVIDMGASTTGFAVFRKGRFAGADVIPVGGSHVTTDIAHGLSTTIAHAERLKTMFGTVLSLGHDEREALAVPLLGERGVDSVHHVPKSMLTAIIRPRVEETLEMVRAKIDEASAFAGVSRLVLTGGASQLQGLRELAGEMFGCPVRIGQPLGLQGLSEATVNPSLAGCAGLFAMAMSPERQLAMPDSARDALVRANMGYTRRVGRWLKEAL